MIKEAARICLFALVLHVWGQEIDKPHFNRLLHQTLNLTSEQIFTQPVKEVTWYFTPTGRNRRRMCQCPRSNANTCGNKSFELHSECTTLLIKNLTLGESGKFEREIIFQDETTGSSSFHLMVYEPVPTPAINVSLGSIDSNSCNVTLHCFVTANTVTPHYAWRTRGLEEKAYVNVSRIELSLSLKSRDTEYQCVVYNLLSEKTASVHPLRTCRTTGRGHERHNYYIVLSSLIILLPVMAWFAVVLYKTMRKERDSAPEETYCEVEEPSRHQMENYQNIRRDPKADRTTIYSLLQRDEI